ncbi:MAG: type III pantothenate kinase [Ruminococcus sp.]|nr:type III pantothenate kinase [Ruminococcus sp.]
MILAVDIGNTSVSLGVFDGERLVFKSKLSADRLKTSDEYAILLSDVFEKNKVDSSAFDGAILLSVVPSLTHTVSSALKAFGVTPMIVGAGIKTGLNIRTEIPSSVGADIVAATVASMQVEKAPMIVLDFGTATTLTAINAKGELCGCIIAPGVKTAFDAMTKSCSLLTDVPLLTPKTLLGKNTADSMNSGVVWGNALMIDGFIKKIRSEYEIDESAAVIATGGLAQLIVPLCETKIRCEPNLTLNGLYHLYKINQKKK